MSNTDTTPASERSLAASLASHTSWANTENRSARTARARRALDEKFLAQADGDPIRAEHLRQAHYKSLALKSARARRKAKEAREAAQAVEAELAQLDETGGDGDAA